MNKVGLVCAIFALVMSLLLLSTLSYAQVLDSRGCALPDSIWMRSYNPTAQLDRTSVYPREGVDVATYGNNVVSLGRYYYRQGVYGQTLTFHVIKYDADGNQICLADYNQYTSPYYTITPKGVVANPDGSFRVIAESYYQWTGTAYLKVDYNSACGVTDRLTTGFGGDSFFINDVADNGAATGYSQYKYAGYNTWDIIAPGGSLIKSYGSSACSGTGGAVAVDRSGNIIAVGSTCDGSFIVKLAPDGREIWRKTAGSSRLAVDSQNNLITVAGSSVSKLNLDVNTNTDDYAIQFSVAPVDFSVSVLPPSRSGTFSPYLPYRGASANGIATAALIKGTSQPVTWSYSSAAPGVGVTFSPAACTPWYDPDGSYGTSCDSAMAVTGVTPGTYPVTITGTSGGLARTARFFLTVAGDTTAPVRSNGLPSTVLPAGTTQTTISLQTDEPAGCKYSTTADLPFYAAYGYGGWTGLAATADRTSHSGLVTGLAPGNTYTYYVKCEDTVVCDGCSYGNYNANDYLIQFSVSLVALPETAPPPAAPAPAPDRAAPARSNGLPSTALPAGTAQANISLQTDELANCRYSTAAGQSYSSMTAFSNTGGTSHSTLVTGLSNGANYAYYVKCEDSAVNPVWSKSIPGISVKSLAVDSADNILVAGVGLSGQDAVLVKLDRDGNEKWREAYSSCVPNIPSGYGEEFWGVAADSDTNVIVTGRTYRNGGTVYTGGPATLQAYLHHTTMKYNSTPPPGPCDDTTEEESKVCCESKGRKWLRSGEVSTVVDSQFMDSGGVRKASEGVRLQSGEESCGGNLWAARSKECSGVDICVNNQADDALCDKATDCVYNGKCYSDIKAVAATFFSNNQLAVWNSAVWKPEVAADLNGDGEAEVCDPGMFMRPSGTVAGIVVDSTTGVPLGGATVSMVSTTGVLTFTAVTAADGTYTINNVAGGTYDITAFKVGYNNAVKINEPIQPFQLNTVDFQLNLLGGVWGGGGAGIGGRVANITGQPVAGAVVQVLGTTFTAVTAGDGTYAIAGVPTGRYDIVASKASDDYSDALAIGVILGIGQVTVDFTLLHSLGGCTNDCTPVGSNVCDQSCEGKGSCRFYSGQTKQACDGTFGIIDLPGGRQVNCCKGQPYVPQKANVVVPAKNVVKTVKPVLYRGKLVNLITLLFIPD